MNWETVLGLEVHVELKTKSKIFCECTTEFEGDPNTHCCPGCWGMPGTLPVLNKKVLEFALKAGMVLNCDITRDNKFDRKNYFYPDLPRAYQISQLYYPFARNGVVNVTTRSGLNKDIRIHEIHMEEDAGKLIHSPFEDATFPDYNRSGMPLIEIVSEPDFRSGEEVVAYIEKLKSILEYLDISDCKMQEGSMRVDVNLSVRPVGTEKLGVRTEMKNMNSLKAIERAIEFEAKRHIEVIEGGGKLVQQTRRWDDNKGKSTAMRSKENADDYRYFPDPDLPPVHVSEEMLEALKKELPEFADAKKARYTGDMGLSDYDASILVGNKKFAELFETVAAATGEPKEVANWLIGPNMHLMQARSVDFDGLCIRPDVFTDFVKVIVGGKVNRNVGKKLFELVFDGEEGFDVNQYIKDNNLGMVEDTGAVQKTVNDVLAANPKTVEEYKAGKTKVFGFLIGECMKVFKGKVKPDLVNKVMAEEIKKYL